MKCVKLKDTKKIIRVNDDEARHLVATQQAEYASKSDWKQQKTL